MISRFLVLLQRFYKRNKGMHAKAQLSNLIKDLNCKADEMWEKMPTSDERSYSVGYMSGLEYAAYRIKQLLDESNSA